MTTWILNSHVVDATDAELWPSCPPRGTHPFDQMVEMVVQEQLRSLAFAIRVSRQYGKHAARIDGALQ